MRSDDDSGKKTTVVLSDSDVESQDRFQEPVEQSSDEDDSSDDPDPTSEAGADEQAEGDDMDLEELIPVSDGVEQLPAQYQKQRRKWAPRTRKPQDASTKYTRGVPDRIEQKLSVLQHKLYHLGASESDHQAVDAARRRWTYEPTLPSRVEDAKGFGGMHASFFVDDQAWSNLAEQQRHWWTKCNGEHTFSSAQVTEVISEASALEYMPERQMGVFSFLMGPYQDPLQLKLNIGAWVPLSDAWNDSTLNNEPLAASNYKHGFVVNLGAKVNCVDWAPHKHGINQFLAVSNLPERKSSHPKFKVPKAPAFTPRPPHKSNVQLWKFEKNQNGHVNTSIAPQLEIVLCTDWGDVKALKWCPMAHVDTTPARCSHIGLLAAIGSDGALRVLSVDRATKANNTEYLHVKRAPFESKPPDTLCTCLTWISSTRIAAGCANGCIAVWDIPQAIESDSSNTRPVIYSAIATTYILSVETCYPSRPNVLLAASMAGIVTMTNLSRSGQSLVSQGSTVPGVRTRMILPLLVWHDFSQTAVHAEDNGSIKGSTLRRFFANISLARAKSSATSIASSPCHPFLLIGCADGEVFATNPLSRIVDAGRSETWQQAWFTHEWRHPQAQTSTEEQLVSTEEMLTNRGTSTDADDPATESNGMSRFVEGMKAEFVALAGDRSGGDKQNRHKGTTFTTVFEEKSAVTAVAWNPNLHVGGWAAAGMGDGLLRVEDISI